MQVFNHMALFVIFSATYDDQPIICTEELMYMGDITKSSAHELNNNYCVAYHIFLALGKEGF